MKALLVDHGRAQLREVPIPSRSGECLVRVTLAGICGTDLHMLQGYADYSGILGHEFVGAVEESPPDHAEWRGRRVVGEINVGCGRCPWCTSGAKEHCPERTVLGIKERDGTFAELLSLPAANLHEVPATMEDHVAVFTEPVAAACRILEQIALGAETHVAVIGDGRLGLLTAQVLRSTGAQVLVVGPPRRSEAEAGRHEEKLAIARQLGLEAAALTQDGLRTERRFDVVVDVTGRPEGLACALDLVRPRGAVVLKSTFHGATPLEAWPAVVHEVTLIGSRCGPFAAALDLLARGTIQTAPLLAGEYPLHEHHAAFNAAQRRLKVLFRM